MKLCAGLAYGQGEAIAWRYLWLAVVCSVRGGGAECVLCEKPSCYSWRVFNFLVVAAIRSGSCC